MSQRPLPFTFVTPAKAGVQILLLCAPAGAPLDSGFRRNDGQDQEACHG
jgi:hypothetical protein